MQIFLKHAAFLDVSLVTDQCASALQLLQRTAFAGT